MSAAEHIAKAESLLNHAKDMRPETAALYIARAQVHASLAIALTQGGSNA